MQKENLCLLRLVPKHPNFHRSPAFCSCIYTNLFLIRFTLNSSASYTQDTWFLSETELTDRLITFLKTLYHTCSIIVGCLIYELYTF
jgi:hypothetical protein